MQEEIHSNIVRVDRAISELWNFRDDSHIAAWQGAGYSGPTLDVLSQVWGGKDTTTGVASELDGGQELFEVESHFAMLIDSGDIERRSGLLTLTAQGKDRRDRIEFDTDDRYFRGWPGSDDLMQMGDDLAALIAALP